MGVQEGKAVLLIPWVILCHFPAWSWDQWTVVAPGGVAPEGKLPAEEIGQYLGQIHIFILLFLFFAPTEASPSSGQTLRGVSGPGSCTAAVPRTHLLVTAFLGTVQGLLLSPPWVW